MQIRDHMLPAAVPNHQHEPLWSILRTSGVPNPCSRGCHRSVCHSSTTLRLDLFVLFHLFWMTLLWAALGRSVYTYVCELHVALAMCWEHPGSHLDCSCGSCRSCALLSLHIMSQLESASREKIARVVTSIFTWIAGCCYLHLLTCSMLRHCVPLLRSHMLDATQLCFVLGVWGGARACIALVHMLDVTPLCSVVNTRTHARRYAKLSFVVGGGGGV